jgi:putative SOS response-associated peptidase YedK
MPVILAPGEYDRWLLPKEVPASELQPLLQPYPSDNMVAYPVSRVVNNPSNDVPECIVPVDS